jgi:ABC-type antimicrobial peptide transport system permease subunit
MSEPSARAQFKNVDPPFWVAWNQAIASIRVRFFRQLITSVGIALGIAFYASMQTLRIAESSLTKDDTKMQWLVATSLLMCLVGVTNSMLMSVSERFREIVTIKCLGASDSFIVRVFFLEATILGATGSFAGAAAGVGLSWLAARASGANVAFADCLSITLTATVIGMVMTVLAAVAPAIQAAKMPAAAALRVEV